MHTGYSVLGRSRIHYYCWGTGPKLLFCFHGYGESADSFAFLQQALGRDYTLIAIDLPFHGQTEWEDGLFFAPGDLVLLMEKLSAGLPGGEEQGADRKEPWANRAEPGAGQQALAADRAEPWTIVGFSMGGRVALQLLEMIPEKIGRLVLLAPDGLQMNPWYWLATQTGPGNRFFRFTMAHPAWFFFLLRVGNALKWVNPGIYKFTNRYIDDVKVREDLYTRWTTMRGFRPHLPAIRKLIRCRNIRVQLLFGRYDRIIRWERGERFIRGLESQCRLVVLPSGHQLLQTTNLETLLTVITS